MIGEARRGSSKAGGFNLALPALCFLVLATLETSLTCSALVEVSATKASDRRHVGQLAKLEPGTRLAILRTRQTEPKGADEGK